ncbi:L,D-transpeptidase [Nostocaceae cyanobacterium CENA369]|uniref:L,D-transpeptidase n=1 Tax=Dendronalium phyllosphericum CENA369 TaxID=1725256 RepID=A0A8J7I0B9_9NOST|nr:L,D-transpeptidase [Dendronalium phyllosphericum]MBH8573630.1 L,D-transpeptidase [Dendronalium phyllosphericum CENA369]
MAMIRNESVARIVMFLCFGTAILSLAVYWRITSTQQQFEKPVFAGGNRPANLQEKFTGGIGETAFGASTPPNEATFKTNAQRTNALKFSAVKSNNTLLTGGQNVAEATVPRMRFATPGQQQNFNTEQPLRLPWASNPQKSSSLAAAKTQVVVDLSDRRAYVYARDEVIASYPIAVGKKGWETPTGSFQIQHMQHDPIWRHPITGKVFPAGADSPLGERWIGFWSDGRNQIGFHGTPNTEVMGAAVSHGCLRMRNPDVRLLYEQVKLGTTVMVRE